MRDICATLIGRPAKRAAKFLACWRASRVVGTTTATCLPLIAATKAARSATSVLPKPTSPQTSRSIGLPDGEIVEHGIDGRGLILRLLIGKAGAEGFIEAGRRHELRRGMGLARRGDLHEACRHFENALAHPRLALLPAGAAQLVELDLGVFRAIAREKLEIFDRQKQLVAIGIMQFEAIMRRARRLDRLQPDETADAVIDMDDEIAGRERGDFGEKILRAARLLAAHG